MKLLVAVLFKQRETRKINQLTIMTFVHSCLIVFIFLTITIIPAFGIYNGEPANKDEFPYSASIVRNEEHICSGFIYSERWIVTTASCVSGLQPGDLRVILGRYQLNKPDSSTEQRMQVLRINIKNGYTGGLDINDIALLELTQLIKFGASANFIYYSEENENIPTAVISGWGARGEDLPASLHPNKADVTLNNVTCSNYNNFNPGYMICAGDYDQGDGSPCQYDEGSALVQGNSAIGIYIKRQGPCDSPNFEPAVYARLTAHYSWFRTVAGSQP